MALFGFFNRKNENTNTIPFQLTPVTPVSSVEEATNETPVVEETVSENKPLMVSYATGWPIDIIYGFLHKNYESKGYDDAMLNSNLTFRDMNMNIIRHKILMVFREINLNYDAMKQDLDTRIETCNAAGLLTTAADLNKQMAVINAHKEELSQLEHDFRNNANEASVPLMSYECGFLRGISTIALASPTKTQSIKAPVVSTLNPKSMAV
ncbi:MAG: hypothetical protein MJZ31_09755 [Bacteroidales bacterium]|nr:hypothetical protein [Bacteroidales bacterium]